MSNIGENDFASALLGERAALQKSGGSLQEQSFLLGTLNSPQSSRHHENSHQRYKHTRRSYRSFVTGHLQLPSPKRFPRRKIPSSHHLLLWGGCKWRCCSIEDLEQKYFIPNNPPICLWSKMAVLLFSLPLFIRLFLFFVNEQRKLECDWNYKAICIHFSVFFSFLVI